MALRASLPMTVRRFAAGIDVSAQTVRLVVLSQRWRARGPVRIEHIAAGPLPEGAMAGAEILDRRAVSQALRDVFSGMPHLVANHALHCAMALPASATLFSKMPLARMIAAHEVGDVDRRSLDALEPLMLGEAERIAGIERHALAVDWFVERSSAHPGMVTIAATGRRHLEARIECAATAGISLSTIDGEPHAALRAIRHAALLELELNESYVAVWIGLEGIFGWRITGQMLAAEMRYPSPEHADLIDALRDLTRHSPSVDCVLVGGEIELLDGIGVTIADMGEALGCTALPFECAPLVECDGRPASESIHDPAYVVAFGLALRGVME
ncbi:pilus assembly protein PilM [Paraburkholderia sp.]|uniref:type IV pilus biogenesis protein PilM n=1 Tax=Paraburkholderia sp. TaxID=1926495 RepID=UPI00238DD63A|nr:pilus assembly protein PilM [Paraburkholderia sp.]MDE1180709.1 pilus assembly protein PilM [Paraburkholderia sp.]